MATIVLTTLNMYTMGLFALPIGLISKYMKSPMIFMILMEMVFIAGSVLGIYLIWFPVAFGLLTALIFFEEHSGRRA